VNLFTFITLPGDFISTTTNYIATVFTDIWQLVALFIGLPLAFWFIMKLRAMGRVR